MSEAMLTIAVPFYGTTAQLFPLAARAAAYPAFAEVIFINDGCDCILPIPWRCRSLEMPPPKIPWNIPACVNRAAELARGKYLLILPADHLLSWNGCAALVEWCEQDAGQSVGQLAREGLKPGCGILCIPTAHYLAIGGMDEQYCGNYGYGGNDLRRRLGLPIITVPGVLLTINPAAAEKTLSRDQTINRAKFDAGPRNLPPLKGVTQ